MTDTISLAVWDVPMPAVAGERFAIKAGASCTSGRSLAGYRVEVSDTAGTVVASETLGNAPLPGTEALYWAAIDLPAPEQRTTEYSVRLVAGRDGPAGDAVASRFSVVAVAKPQHRLAIKVTEQDTSAPLGGVEVRLGPFHARTDAAGRAELRVCPGAYQLQLWRNAHIAPAKPVTIDADVSLELTMVHVPEDHPDARWVR